MKVIYIAQSADSTALSGRQMLWGKKTLFSFLKPIFSVYSLLAEKVSDVSGCYLNKSCICVCATYMTSLERKKM